LSQIATHSDEYVKAESEKLQLKDQASKLQNGNESEYNKAVSKFYSAKEKSDKLSQGYTRFIEYLNVLGYLPSSIEEIPSQYRNVAKSMFTKEGKFLLGDKQFRDEFNAKNVVEKDQLKNITDIAKKVADDKINLDDNYVQ